MDAMIDFAKHSTFCFFNESDSSFRASANQHEQALHAEQFFAQQCDGDPQRWLRNVCVLC